MADLDLDAIEAEPWIGSGEVLTLVAALREARAEAKAAWEQAERDLATHVLRVVVARVEGDES